MRWFGGLPRLLRRGGGGLGVELAPPSVPSVPPAADVAANAAAGLLPRPCLQWALCVGSVELMSRGQGHWLNSPPPPAWAMLVPPAAFAGCKRFSGGRAGEQVIRPLSLNYVQGHGAWCGVVCGEGRRSGRLPAGQGLEPRRGISPPDAHTVAPRVTGGKGRVGRFISRNTSDWRT
jgi:hypothetical protein